MGNASSIKIAAMAFVAVVSAHGPRDGPNRTMERCKAPIGRAIKVCKPWISTTCPQASEMHHMRECYLRNRSQAPKQCQRAARAAWACAAKQDATQECTDRACMQCEMASKEAEFQCTETWFKVCSDVDVEADGMAAAKECFMKNRKAFPKRCQRAAKRVFKTCKAEERMQQHKDRAMEAQQQQREHAMERMHREQEQKMEEMMQTTRRHHRQMEHKEMEHDRQMETAHEHMHPGMTHENHAQMETDMRKEHMHHEANMAMEAEMQTGVHQMEDMDRQAELLTTSAMDATMNMHMHQEDMMQQEHAMMEAAPVDHRPISHMTMPMPTMAHGPSTGTDMPTTWTHGDGMPNDTGMDMPHYPSTEPTTWTHGDTMPMDGSSTEPTNWDPTSMPHAPSTEPTTWDPTSMPHGGPSTGTEPTTWTHGDNMPNGQGTDMPSTHMPPAPATWHAGDNMPNGDMPSTGNGPNMDMPEF